MVSTYQTLKQNVSNLSGGDRQFAESLISQMERKGNLSDKQMFHVNKLAKKATGEVLELVAVGDLSGMVSLFEKAKQHLKRPAITMAIPEIGEVKFSLAGSRANQPGTINVSTPGRFGENVWYGRVNLQGKWQPSHERAPEGLVELITSFANDPAGTASRYGRLTGSCCFCNRPLKDDRSTEVGYGPVCADHFGLPWGE